jgi:DNA-directed RNA polymerase subunit RPC12/RpoP
MAKKPVKNGMKVVPCTYCRAPIEVSQQAMSIFCPHCHKRVVCEDYCIRSYHAVRLFATCGDIVVEKKGHVVAPVLANSLVVRGLVKGNVRVQSVVEIDQSGTIQGNVESPRLILHDGGKLIGECRIVPIRTKPQEEPSAQEPAAESPADQPAPAKSGTSVRPQRGASQVAHTPPAATASRGRQKDEG